MVTLSQEHRNEIVILRELAFAKLLFEEFLKKDPSMDQIVEFWLAQKAKSRAMR